MPPAFSGFRYSLKPIRSFVVAGQKRVFALDVPATHVALQPGVKTGMPGIADKFTQSAQGRLLRPGMTIFAISPISLAAFCSRTLSGALRTG